MLSQPVYDADEAEKLKDAADMLYHAELIGSSTYDWLIQTIEERTGK